MPTQDDYYYDERTALLYNSSGGKPYTDEFNLYEEANENLRERTGISWYSATFLAVNCCLGIGLLELPWAYNAAGGLLPASTVHYAVLALMTGGLAILAYIAHLTQASSYQEATLMVLGNFGQKVCIVLMVVEGAGVCVMCLVVTGDHVEKFVASVISEEFVTTWYGNQKALVTILGLLILLPMCLLREINGLKYASAMGFVGMIYIVGLIVVKYFLRSTEVVSFNTKATWIDTLLIAPGVSLAYMCHFEMTTIFAAMSERNTMGFAKTTAATILICAVFNTLVPVFGYLSFGDEVNKEIILSYFPTADIYISYFVLALKCLTAFPVIFFCIRNAVRDLWLDVWSMTPDEAARSERKHLITMGVIGFLLILGIYIAVPDIVTVVAYAGGFGFFFSCIFPGLSLIKSVIDKTNVNLRKATESVLIGVGVLYVTSGFLLFGVITAQEIMNTRH